LPLSPKAEIRYFSSTEPLPQKQKSTIESPILSYLKETVCS
jgi:hypothetical protein